MIPFLKFWSEIQCLTALSAWMQKWIPFILNFCIRLTNKFKTKDFLTLNLFKFCSVSSYIFVLMKISLKHLKICTYEYTEPHINISVESLQSTAFEALKSFSRNKIIYWIIEKGIHKTSWKQFWKQEVKYHQFENDRTFFSVCNT